MKTDTEILGAGPNTETTRPVVSIIMPTYNRAAYISESVMSALNQEFKDIEIVIVDDGSIDNTDRIISNFNDTRIIYIRQENRGVVAARNAGIKVARGEYIFFLDSDDVLLKNAIGKVVKLMNEHPEVGFSYAQAYVMDEKGRIYGLRNRQFKKSYIVEGMHEIKKALLNGNHIPLSTIVVRRDCLEKTGLFNRTFYSGSEDYEFWVRMAKQYPVAYIAEPIIKYRVHNSSLTSGRSLTEMEKHNSLIIEWIFSDTDIRFSSSVERKHVYAKMFLRLSYFAYGNREMEISREYLFKSFKLQPSRSIKYLCIPLVFRLFRTWVPPKVLDWAHEKKRYISIMSYMFCFKLRQCQGYFNCV